MQQIVQVLIPADSYDLLSIEEAKTILGLATADTSHDDQILLLIEVMSDQVARTCGRVFGYETVTETFTDMVAGTQRLYLSRWPAKLSDVESFTVAGTDVMLDTYWILEEETGVIYRKTGFWVGEVEITYSGGYELPEQAPAALKQATMILTRENYFSIIRGDSSVRSISHKESRVMYFAPNQMVVNQGGTGGSGASVSSAAVDSLLSHFRRHWV